MPHISGLAASIRGATESETFDLGGQNVTTITNNVTAAFTDPLPTSEMIRITFVTGAGKLARQKYDPDAAKAITSALRVLNFEEDRGASCVKECAGSFKIQHDTGKNLKTVVVFPRITENSTGGNEDGNATSDDAAGSRSIFPEGSAEEKIALSSKAVFENMVKSKCPSWSQKKGIMAALVGIKQQLEELEQKLLSGTPLSDPEQSFYDSVSSNALEEKQNAIKDFMHHQVDDGLITSREKTQLLSQVNERLETIQKELTDAEKDNKPKKVEKLTTMKVKAEARKVKLTNITPKQPHRLKREAEIIKFRKELQPLLEMEDEAKGRLLSIKETKSLARKEEILEEIIQLEENSRGWFEDDEDFLLRIEACNAAWAVQSKQKKKTTKTAATSGSAWKAATSMSRPISSSAWRKPKPAAKKTSGGGGGVFGAMMMDSDSD